MTAPSPLSPAIRNYPWGSRTAIPALLGQRPDGEPQAELWFGAHRAAPSLLPDRPGRPDPAAAITADPVKEPGEASLAAHGPGLPFLLKVLAAERALSVQVHPTRRQAQNGHGREEAAGVPFDAPHRTFKDHNQPEPLCALEPFEALCGFREPARTMRPAVMRPTPTGPAGETQFCSPTEEFVLSRLETGTEAVSVTDPGPQVLLCLVGHVRLTSGPTLSRGAAAFVPAGSPCEVTGGGAVLYRARVPLSAAP